MAAHIRRWEDGQHADGVVDGRLQRVVVQRGVVASVAEVEVLGDAGPQRCRLADVDAHALVES